MQHRPGAGSPDRATNRYIVDGSSTRLAKHLYIGAEPPMGPGLYAHGFDVLVLCAEEYQPPSSQFPGLNVFHVPFDDSVNRMGRTQIRRLQIVAQQVAEEWKRGKRVLVTCHMGINRSALMSALVMSLISGESPAECGSLIRGLRTYGGMRALDNPYFRTILSELSLDQGGVHVPAMGRVDVHNLHHQKSAKARALRLLAP